MQNSVSAEFCVDGIPCRRNSARRNSVLTEFRVDGIPCRLGDSVSTGGFRVNRIPCGHNSMSTEFCIDGILCQQNSVDTQLYILLKS
jgi:hypothetical protein